MRAIKNTNIYDECTAAKAHHKGVDRLNIVVNVVVLKDIINGQFKSCRGVDGLGVSPVIKLLKELRRNIFAFSID